MEPNYLAYDEWLVEENEAGERVAAFTRVESIITDEWRQGWQEELCEADLLDEAELAELEIQYLHDQSRRNDNQFFSASEAETEPSVSVACLIDEDLEYRETREIFIELADALAAARGIA